MRTLGDMRYEVRRKINDVADDSVTDPAVDRALSDGLEVLARDLLVNPIGKRILRTHSTATSLVVDQEEYDLPTDNLQLDRVYYRDSASTDRWTTLEYRPPQPGKTPPPLFWFDDLGLMQVRIWPSFASIGSEEYRYRYYRMPPFPSSDDGTFNDPDATGSDVNAFPPEFDSVVELRAALLLASEENLNTAPIQFLNDMYNRHVQALVQGVPMTYPDRQYRAMYQTNQQEED